MKKHLLIWLALLAMLLPCVAFSACSSDSYTGKQFRLVSVSASYDETVTEEKKAEQENAVLSVREKIDGDDAPYCRFYTLFDVMLTNCNGNYRFARYKVNGGNVSIDITTSQTQNKLKLPIRMKFFNDDSLENAVLSKEHDNLVMRETNDGITVEYVFVADGDVNESTDEFVGSKYEFADVSYITYTTDETRNKTEYSAAESNYDTYALGGSISFENATSCIIFRDLESVEHDIKQSQKNQHSFSHKSPNSNSWVNYNVFFIYGDLLVLNGYSSAASHSIYVYFIKAD